jgi:hypothetical protein
MLRTPDNTLKYQVRFTPNILDPGMRLRENLPLVPNKNTGVTLNRIFRISFVFLGRKFLSLPILVVFRRRLVRTPISLRD